MALYNTTSNLGSWSSSLLTFLSYFIIFIVVVRFLQFVILSPVIRNPNYSTNRPVFTNRRGGSSKMHPIPPPFRYGEDNTAHPSTSETNDTTTEYEASPADVLAVKKLLMAAGNLPLELADMIVDQAEYWPCTSVTADYSALPRKVLGIRGSGNDENKFLLRTEPMGLSSWTPPNHDSWRSTQALPHKLGRELDSDCFREFVEEPPPVSNHPVRKLVFNIRSCDQGWGGNPGDQGTYRHSWTWFDAGLERFDAEAQCDENCPSYSTDGEAKEAKEGKGKGTRICSCAVRPVWPVVVTDEGNDGAAVPPRYDPGLHPTSDHMVQANKVATPGMQQHHVVWRWDDNVDPDSSAAEDLEKSGRGRATGNGEFVRSIKLGDIVTLWGRARFAGWENRVERVEVKVYWAV
ncbi:ankyrin repeat protein [Apiospora marii]|uniref:Ankyrin repeat protein n=1 Tax=Apiospora marii TaxID=335849 RepID=A0ABR1RE51_9PEZI